MTAAGSIAMIPRRPEAAWCYGPQPSSERISAVCSPSPGSCRDPARPAEREPDQRQVTREKGLWGAETVPVVVTWAFRRPAFFALGTTQLAVALGSRARPGTLANPALLWAVAGALGLQFAGIYLPFLNDLLKTRPLTAFDLLVVFALSTLGYAAIRLDRVVHRDGRWWPGVRRRRPGAP